MPNFYVGIDVSAGVVVPALLFNDAFDEAEKMTEEDIIDIVMNSIKNNGYSFKFADELED